MDAPTPCPDTMLDWPWRRPEWIAYPGDHTPLILGLLQHLAGRMTPGERITRTDIDAIREALQLCREQAAEINAGRLEALK